MTFYFLDDSNNRLVMDSPTASGFVQDPCDIFSDTFAPVDVGLVQIRTDAAPRLEALGTVAVNYASSPAEIIGTIRADLALALEAVVSVFSTLVAAAERLSTPFTDWVVPRDATADISSPRPAGFRSDPDNIFLMTDGGDRLVPDEDGLSPITWQNDVFRYELIPIEPIVSAKADRPNPIEIVSSLQADTRPPVEISGAINSDRPISKESLVAEQRDTPMPVERVEGLAVDTSHDSQVEFGTAELADSGIREEIVGGVGPSAVIRDEFSGSLQRDTPMVKESLTTLLALAVAVIERTFDVKLLSTMPLEALGTVKDDSAPRLEIGIGSRIDTPLPVEIKATEAVDAVLRAEHTFDVTRLTPTPLEHTFDVRRDTFMPMEFFGYIKHDTPSPVEHTFDVKPLAPFPLEHTFDVRQLSRSPFTIGGGIYRDTRFPIEFKEMIVVDMAHDFDLEFGIAVQAKGVVLMDHLSGIAYSLLARLEEEGTVYRDTIMSLERTGHVMSTGSTPPLEHLLGEQGIGIVPLDRTGHLSRDTASLVEFKGTLSRMAPVAMESLARLQQDRALALEHLATVTGLTPSRAAWSGSVASTGKIPADFMGHLLRDTAAIVERLAGVRSQATGRVEWRGAFLVDSRMPVDHLFKLLPVDHHGVIEITLDVTHDSGIPLSFHGFAFIQKPSLIGTDEEINLLGTNGQILLVGEVGN